MSRTFVDRRGWTILLAVSLVLLGALSTVLNAPPREQDRSALGRTLDFRGPVRRIVETETHVDAISDLGTSQTRTVTEVARDGRSARVTSVHTYRSRKGETTNDRTEARYLVTGLTGREVVRASSWSANDQTETVSQFDGPCVVQSVDRFTNKRETYEEVTETTCDGRGRMLSQITRQSGKEISRATYRWLPGGFALQRLWVAALGDRPAYENNGFLRYNTNNNGLDAWTPLANVKSRYSYDPRGNWVWRKTELTPKPLSGNNLYERNITYWNE